MLQRGAGAARAAHARSGREPRRLGRASSVVRRSAGLHRAPLRGYVCLNRVTNTGILSAGSRYRGRRAARLAARGPRPVTAGTCRRFFGRDTAARGVGCSLFACDLFVLRSIARLRKARLYRSDEIIGR